MTNRDSSADRTALRLETRERGQERNARRTLAIILVVAAIAKLALLAIVGPSFQLDSPGYVSYANEILAGTAFRPFDLGAAALPDLAFRMPGYPLVIAGAKLLSVQHWPEIVVMLQGLATLATSALIFTVLRRVFVPLWMSCFVIILYLCSESLLWDNAIMSDSLYASLFGIVVFALLGTAVDRWRLSPLTIFGLGLLWGGSLLFRDSGLYFTYLPLLPLAAVMWRDRGKGWFCAKPIAGFFLAVLAVVECYVAFNRYRTGVAFFGITGVANWLRPAFDMAQYHYAKPFTGDGIVAAVMRGLPPVYDFPAQLQFLQALHERCGCNAVAMNAIVFHRYIVTVLRHPFAYIAVIWHNFNYLGLGSLLADPLSTLNQFIELGTPVAHRIIPGLSLRHLIELHAHFSLEMLVLMILATISTTISALLFTLLILGVPYIAWHRWRAERTFDAPLAVAFFSWFAFLSFSIAFSMIHYEARHALPILPLGLTGIAYGLWQFRTQQSA